MSVLKKNGKKTTRFRNPPCAGRSLPGPKRKKGLLRSAGMSRSPTYSEHGAPSRAAKALAKAAAAKIFPVGQHKAAAKAKREESGG